jgi:translocation and assembly module TamA
LDKGDDAAIIENIQESLSLYDTIGKEQGESRLEYLLSQAERQTRQALEPFGYYNPVIKVEAPREDEHVRVLIHVDKGTPVTVRREHIDITGPAMYDQYLQDDLAAFKPRKGQRFEHTQYEASKITITRAWPSVATSMPTTPSARCRSPAPTMPPTST